MLSGLTQRLGLGSGQPPPPVPAFSEDVSDQLKEDADDNEPPPFPLPNSIQRAGGSRLPPNPPSFTFEPPPLSVAGAEDDNYEADNTNDERAPLPPSRQVAGALKAPASTTKLAKRVKVSIEPGFSQLDWARLKSGGTDLRGGTTSLQRISLAELAQHKKKDDCWQAYGGKVYNVTPFLRFHPGGVGELMRAAGRDGTELFMKTHAWVNVELMMDACLIGFLVRE